VEQAVFYAEGERIEEGDIFLPERRPAAGGESSGYGDDLSWDEIERRVIESRLKRFRYNKRETAKSLGMGESTLYKKIKDYGLGRD